MTELAKTTPFGLLLNIPDLVKVREVRVAVQ